MLDTNVGASNANVDSRAITFRPPHLTHVETATFDIHVPV